MEKIKELFSLCNGSVEISINAHKDYYQKVEDWLSPDDKKYINNEVYQQMIERDIIVRLQVYPDTPVGFFLVYHYDIDKAVEIALNILKGEIDVIIGK